MSSRVHAIYLAVIVVLTLIVVYAIARAVRAQKVMTDVERRFGLGAGARASFPRPEELRPFAADKLLRPRTYDEYAREVDALVARAQALGEFGPASRLAAACGAAVAGGKRLRAVILLEVARAAALGRQRRASRQAAGGSPGSRGQDEPALVPVDAAEAALFIEYIHAASLVVDDLPEFDNDATRRGKPAIHVAAGPAVAQMAAMALIAAAFQNICRQIDWLRDHCPEVRSPDRIGTQLCNEVSRALGALGAAGGQYMDVSGPDDLRREYGDDAVADLVARKTATFFEIAVVAGWLTAGGDPGQLGAVRAAGRQVGTAFQIADDLGDMARDAARRAAGKPGWNFANEYGEAAARQELDRNLRGARYLLVQCGLWTPLWENELFPLVHRMAEPEPPDAGGAVPREAPGEAPGGALIPGAPVWADATHEDAPRTGRQHAAP